MRITFSEVTKMWRLGVVVHPDRYEGGLFLLNSFIDSKIAVKHAESALKACIASRSYCSCL